MRGVDGCDGGRCRPSEVGVSRLLSLPGHSFTSPVKSDHCSTRKARTEAGSQGRAVSAMIAPNRLARSADTVEASRYAVEAGPGERAADVGAGLRHAFRVVRGVSHHEIEGDGEHQCSRGSSRISPRRQSSSSPVSTTRIRIRRSPPDRSSPVPMIS